MDSVFGIGAPELIVILLLAGIVMGPQRIRQVALWLGRTTAQLQSISRGFIRQLNAELDSVDDTGDIRDAMSEIKELRRQVGELKRDVTVGMMAPVQESQKILNESQQMLRQSVTLPKNSDDKEKQSEAAPEQKRTAKPESSLPNLVEVPDDPE